MALLPEGRIYTIAAGAVCGVLLVAALKKFNPGGVATKLGL